MKKDGGGADAATNRYKMIVLAIINTLSTKTTFESSVTFHAVGKTWDAPLATPELSRAARDVI
ncbi:MAG: hypothetical protein ACRD19_08160 [Terriglobia bacterium]